MFGIAGLVDGFGRPDSRLSVGTQVRAGMVSLASAACGTRCGTAGWPRTLFKQAPGARGRCGVAVLLSVRAGALLHDLDGLSYGHCHDHS